MNIGFLGTGSVSQKLGQLLLNAGHSVRLGSRTPATSREKLLRLPVELDTYLAVAEWAEIVVLGVPYQVLAEVLTSLSDQLAGKVVIDPTNPIHADWSPRQLGEQNSAGEEVDRMLPGAYLVKAFNTVFANMMEADRIAAVPGGITGFYCGNHPSANEVVGRLIADVGLRPVEVGSIENARYLEAAAHLNIQLAVGMGGGTNAAFVYIRLPNR